MKLAFYLKRLIIFNKLNGYFISDIFVKKNEYELKSKKKSINLMHPILENGLEEVAFGKLKDNNESLNILSKRLKLLQEQQAKLLEFNGMSPLYNANITFLQMFQNDIEMSYNVLSRLENISIIKANGNINSEYFKKALFNLVKDKIKLDQNKVDTVFEILSKDVNGKKGICSMLLFDTNMGIEIEDFYTIKHTFNCLLQDLDENLFMKLSKFGMTDITSKYSNFRLGHMYFEALEIAKRFDILK